MSTLHDRLGPGVASPVNPRDYLSRQVSPLVNLLGKNFSLQVPLFRPDCRLPCFPPLQTSLTPLHIQIHHGHYSTEEGTSGEEKFQRSVKNKVRKILKNCAV